MMETMSIIEFVLARMAEDEAREFEGSGIPRDVAEKTIWGASLRFNYEMRRLGYALAWSPPLRPLGYRFLVRAKAQQYADHPDFDDSWRATAESA